MHSAKTARLWWLHPAAIFGIATTGLGFATYWVPASTYRDFWRTPKFFDVSALYLTLAVGFFFALGALVTSAYLSRAPERHNPDLAELVPWRSARFLFYLSFGLTLLGYLIWTVLAIQRGMSLQTIIEIASGEPGAMYEARFVYLPTVGGVTTLTQFGTSTVILGALLGYLRGWRSVVLPMSLLLCMALVRALVNSERFALIELFVPFFLATLALHSFFSGRGAFIRTALKIAPVFGVLALVGLFTGFEYFRSWSNYFAGRDMSLLEFGATRLLGYYVTSLNNGAFLLNYLDPLYAPYFTAHFAWRFPLTAPVIERMFPDPILHSAEKWFYFPFLEQGANVEFNNGDGMFFPLFDYGITGGLVYWFLAGLACGALYAWFCQKRPAGILLFPVLYLGLMETPLALYWGEGRAFPALMLLMLAPLVFRFVRRWERLAARPQFEFSPQGAAR